MSVEEARPSLHDPATPWERQLLLWAVPLLLLLAALDGSFFRPGFAAYDEEAQMDLVQAWREGMPLQWRYGYGCLTRAMTVSGFWLLGPNEAWLRLPAMLAVGLEALLLFAWLKPRLGERAALWACLAVGSPISSFHLLMRLADKPAMTSSSFCLRPRISSALTIFSIMGLMLPKSPTLHALWRRKRHDSQISSASRDKPIDGLTNR
jgi:hypothetical protein